MSGSAPRSASLGRLMRYGAAGGVGALLDYAFFLAACALLGNVYAGRAVAMVTSISCMYLLHRKWTFRAQDRPGMKQYAAFGLVQLGAAGCNYAAFTLASTLGAHWLSLPPLLLHTLAFALGCAVGLGVNYRLLSRNVFRCAA